MTQGGPLIGGDFKIYYETFPWNIFRPTQKRISI